MENGSLPFGGTNASVAQLVVQRTCNAKVEGSSPFTGTNHKYRRVNTWVVYLTVY